MKSLLPVLAFVLCSNVHAQSPDASFGTDGISLTSFGTDSTFTPSGSLLMPDGRVLVVGTAFAPDISDFFIARFTVTGAPDATFGGNGLVLGAGLGSNSFGWALALQPDGKVLLAGTLTSGNDRHFLARRYLTDGTLDATFGTAGTWTSNWTIREEPRSIALQSDGKILLAGQWTAPVARAVIIRLNADGTVDTGYGDFGAVSHPNTTSSSWAWHVVVQPDGKALVTGDVDDEDAYLVRLNTDGTPDATFSSDGFVDLNNTTHYDSGFRVVVAPDGTIRWLDIGFDDDGNAQPWVYKIGADGSFMNYGSGTSSQLNVGASAYPLAIALDMNDHVLVAAENWLSPNNAVLARNTPAGLPDPVFGTGGSFTIGEGSTMVVSGLHVRPDGRILFVGSAGIGPTVRIFLAQYSDVPAGIPAAAAEVLVALSPNPGEGRYTITSSAPRIDRLEVTDTEGHLLQSMSGLPSTATIDLRSLPTGAYVARAITKDNVSTVRFIQY